MSSHATRGSWSRRALAVAGSAVLMVGVGVVTAPAALAAGPDTSASHASAQYLSGTWNTTGATADYTGNGTETPDPAVTASNDVAGVGPIGIPGIAFINGAVGSERAEAGPNGKSWAASARVSANGQPQDAASVDFDLGKILDFLGVKGVTDSIHLKLQEVAGIAALDAANPNPTTLATTCADWSAPDQCRGYSLKTGTLDIESAAIKALMAQIQTLAGQIDAAIPVYYDGALPPGVGQLISDQLDSVIRPGLQSVNLPGSYKFESLSIPPADITLKASGTVAAALATILGSEHKSADESIIVNLAAGTISVDYSKLIGGLNGLAPNTPLFDATVVASIQSSLKQIIQGISNELFDDIKTVLQSIVVNADATVKPTVGFEVSTTSIGTCTQTKSFNLFGQPYSYCVAWDGVCEDSIEIGPFRVLGIPKFSACFKWQTITTKTHPTVTGTATLNLAKNAGGDPLTLWDLIHAQGVVNVHMEWDAAGLGSMPLPVQGFLAVAAGLVNASSPLDLSALGLDAFIGPAVDGIIQGLIDTGTAAVKSASDAVVQSIADLLQSVDDRFSIVINAQDTMPDGAFRVSALKVDIGSAAPVPLRSAKSAFASSPRPAAVVAPAFSLRLGTAIVGPNRDALTCVAGTHYDPKTGTCVKDSTPGGGGPGGDGGGTPTTPPTTTTTTTTEPTTEVLGTSDTVSPQSPSVEVSGESGEVTTTEVVGLAETGPRQLGLIALLGLELLLGGIAVMRLTARRRRAAHHHHHA